MSMHIEKKVYNLIYDSLDIEMLKAIQRSNRMLGLMY